jgi:hypothetical protein
MTAHGSTRRASAWLLPTRGCGSEPWRCEEPNLVSAAPREYTRVIVFWVLVLAALYAFQEYFS